MNHVRCRVCNERMGCTTTTLTKHTFAAHHEKNSKLNNLPVILDFHLPVDNEIDRIMAICELKFCAMIASLGISFNKNAVSAKKLSNIDKNSCFGLLSISPTKTQAIVTKVISPVAKSELAGFLQKTKFSICLDESNDRRKKKVLDILVRYPDVKSRKICTKMWNLPEVFIKKQEAFCGAERISNIVKNSFTKHAIPLGNIVECCTDGCKAMVRDISGLKARLQALIPHLIWIQCPAHKTNLCASHALCYIPLEILQLVCNLYGMLNSSNKLQDFENTQAEFGLPLHKIRRYIQERWLSLEQCVTTDIEQWPALLKFSEELAKKKEKLGTSVFNAMRKLVTMCFFYILQLVLGHLNTLNKFFQTKKPVNPQAAGVIEATYKNIVSIFMDSTYVNKTAAKNINIYDQDKQLSFKNWQFGEDLKKAILKCDDTEQANFFFDTYLFIVAMCLELKLLFDNFNDRLLLSFSCLDPAKASDVKFHKNRQDLFLSLLHTFSFLLNNDLTDDVLKNQWDCY